MRPCPCFLLLVLLSAPALAAPPDTASLPWRERSDWVNVKTDVTPAAVGDGRADDTAASQAALDLGRQSKAVYLPTGTYRITKTLVLGDPAVGCLVVGHGRDTRLVWDGPQGGRMFWSDSVAYSRYVGLSWDGQSQFYVEPKEPRFLSKGSRPVRLILAGHFWYDTNPRFELGPEVKLTLPGNREVPDSGVDDEAMRAIAAALDDLRRLGELDQRVSRPGL